VYTGKTTQPIACAFAAAGVYAVTGTCWAGTGAGVSGSLTVNVVGQSFTNQPACWVGMERAWDVASVAPEAVLQADSRLFFEQTGTLAGNGQELGLLIDQNEPRSIVARLGAGGPILASTMARGFNLWSASQTYLKVVRQYPDGSQLVEMLLVLSPVMADLTVELDTIVAGVIFEDGTTTKTLSATDFSANGCATVRFIRPASARTSVCHTIKVFQGADLAGYRH
jgi:hypothetical protein